MTTLTSAQLAKLGQTNENAAYVPLTVDGQKYYQASTPTTIQDDGTGGGTMIKGGGASYYNASTGQAADSSVLPSLEKQSSANQKTAQAASDKGMSFESWAAMSAMAALGMGGGIGALGASLGDTLGIGTTLGTGLAGAGVGAANAELTGGSLTKGVESGLIGGVLGSLASGAVSGASSGLGQTALNGLAKEGASFATGEIVGALNPSSVTGSSGTTISPSSTSGGTPTGGTPTGGTTSGASSSSNSLLDAYSANIAASPTQQQIGYGQVAMPDWMKMLQG